MSRAHCVVQIHGDPNGAGFDQALCGYEHFAPPELGTAV